MRALAKMPTGQARFVQSELLHYAYPQMRQMPFHGANIRRLRDFSPPTWRYRIGQHLVQFHVNNAKRIAYVLAAVDRRDAYR